MKKAKTIAIKQPCGQSWDEMQPTTSGKFCGACQKNVVDFTKYTEEQFIAYFQAYPRQSDLCGRFLEKQLLIRIPPKQAPITFWVAHKVAAASLLAALSFTYKAGAQVKDTPFSNISFEREPDSISVEKPIVISGRLLDENGEGVPAASIRIKGSQSGVMSDLDGNFELELPERDAGYTIVFSGFSLITQEFEVKGSANISITMQEDATSLISGAVVIGGADYEPPMRAVNGEPTSIWEMISRIWRKKKN